MYGTKSGVFVNHCFSVAEWCEGEGPGPGAGPGHRGSVGNHQVRSGTFPTHRDDLGGQLTKEQVVDSCCVIRAPPPEKRRPTWMRWATEEFSTQNKTCEKKEISGNKYLCVLCMAKKD